MHWSTSGGGGGRAEQVDGWADPRMPTVQGLFRRGMQLQALSAFMESQGASKNTNLMARRPPPLPTRPRTRPRRHRLLPSSRCC